MEKNLPTSDHTVVEDDFIDMNLTSTSREFEFQMSTDLPEKEATTSPADELFYKGKLLPLHLPPRLEMVQKLLHNNNDESDPIQDDASIKDSPIRSCHLTSEESKLKKSWMKLSLKLKASRAYLKSLLTKSQAIFAKEEKKLKSPLDKFQNVTSLIRSIERDKLLEEEWTNHRKSFSGAINCHLISKCSPAISSCSSSSSSSFSSVNENRLSGSQLLNRSSSASSEMESSIQGAIAHCKKSQVSARKSVSDIELSTMSASRIVAACEKKERPGLCRG